MIYITTGEGILSWDRGSKIEKVCNLPSFSLNRWKNKWLIVSSQSKSETVNGVAVNFNIKDAKVIILDNNFSVERMIPITVGAFWCHQAFVQDDIMWITDTGNDRLLIVDLITDEVKVHNLTEEHIQGEMLSSKMATDTRHLNSILIDNDSIKLICHNHGPSYYLELNKNLEVVNRINEIGICSHDLIRGLDGEIWFCDSLNRKFKRLDGSKEITLEGFIRGVLISKGIIYIGASCMNPVNRNQGGRIIPYGIHILNGEERSFLDLEEFIGTRLQIYTIVEGDV
jgi:hypothetical protein